MLKYVCVVLFVILEPGVLSLKQCVEPRECKLLKECTSYYNQLPKNYNIQSNKLPIYKELRENICGFRGMDSKVCCPPLSTTSIENHRNIELLPVSCGSIGEDRISNGNITGLLQFPWMALLQYELNDELSFECGGTIINNRYILTAAHCITNLGSKKLVNVRVGEHNLTSNPDCTGRGIFRVCAEAYEDISIEEIKAHDQFNPTTLSNDIGLIRLTKNIQREFFEPICLPTSAELLSKALDDEMSIICGWGTTENGTTSTTLLQARIPVINNARCGEILNRSVLEGIKDTHVCAGGTDGVIACRGDSGGPLKFAFPVNDIQKYIQYGIVSLGSRVCGDDIPGVYTRLTFYMDWVLNNLKPY